MPRQEIITPHDHAPHLPKHLEATGDALNLLLGVLIIITRMGAIVGQRNLAVSRGKWVVWVQFVFRCLRHTGGRKPAPLPYRIA